jgi:HSP20 family protein
MAKEVIRWPGFDFPSIRKEMERFFEGFPVDFPVGASGEWAPPMDISETKEGYNVKAEVPGLDPKDIHIEVKGDLVSIRGERKEEKEEKEENFLRVERSYGSFYRSVRLPSPVDEKNVHAKYTNGVLTVRLPKSEESKRKQIEIKVE